MLKRSLHLTHVFFAGVGDDMAASLRLLYDYVVNGDLRNSHDIISAYTHQDFALRHGLLQAGVAHLQLHLHLHLEAL